MDNPRTTRCQWVPSSHHCTTMNCLPKWVCECQQGGLTRCWKNCPSWAEWVTGSSPYPLAVASEFRRRTCPCDHGELILPDSQVFQVDRPSGHCVQARSLGGTSKTSWDFAYFCLLVFLLMVAFRFKRWCGRNGWIVVRKTTTNLRKNADQNRMEENFA